MKKLTILSAAISTMIAHSANAAVALEPQAIKLDAFGFIPTVAVELQQDSNVYSSSTNEVSSSAMLVSPDFVLQAQDRENVYALHYGLRAGLYEEDNNNFVDHFLDAKGHIEPTDRVRFDLGASFGRSHDSLGTKRTEGFASTVLNTFDPDQYKNTAINAGVEYGAKAATGQVALTAGYNHKRYDTQAARAGYDMDNVNTQFEYRYRIAPKTRMILDLEYNTGDYANAATAAASDYTEKNALIGVTWENSAATTGKLRVGTGKRITSAYSKTKAMWDLDTVWSPLPRDQFTFGTMRRFQDGNGGTIMDTTSYNAGWTHNWLPRLDSTLNLGWSEDSYPVSPTYAAGRDDKTKTATLGLNYQMRRWLVMGAGVSFKDRSSSLAGFDLDRNIYSINAQLSL